MNKPSSLPLRNSLSRKELNNQIKCNIILYKQSNTELYHLPTINCRIKSKILSLIFNAFHNLALSDLASTSFLYSNILVQPSWFILEKHALHFPTALLFPTWFLLPGNPFPSSLLVKICFLHELLSCKKASVCAPAAVKLFTLVCTSVL